MFASANAHPSASLAIHLSVGRKACDACVSDSNEHRLVASLRRLKRRGELERMARDDAIVMIRCGDERLPSVES
jgi:hypothetical protein